MLHGYLLVEFNYKRLDSGWLILNILVIYIVKPENSNVVLHFHTAYNTHSGLHTLVCLNYSTTNKLNMFFSIDLIQHKTLIKFNKYRVK